MILARALPSSIHVDLSAFLGGIQRRGAFQLDTGRGRMQPPRVRPPAGSMPSKRNAAALANTAASLSPTTCCGQERNP
mgnify:CR=1 FL=1